MDQLKYHLIGIITVSIMIFPVTLSNVNQNSFSFSTFNQTHLNLFSVLGDASISERSLEMTPDSMKPNINLQKKSGRVLLQQPFKLWEEIVSSRSLHTRSYKIASFTSKFLVNIYRPPLSNIGEGMAFLIAPEDFSLPSNSHGQWLGLTNETLDGNPSNKFIAIELDTVKQDFDQDGNHLGLNINSVRSFKTFSLSNVNIQISSTNLVVWVEYNGQTRILEVYMAKEGEKKPRSPFISEEVNLVEHLNQYSYMGFAGSTGNNYAEINSVLQWDLIVEELPKQKDYTWVLVLEMVVGGLAGMAILSVVAYKLLRWLNKEEEEKDMTLGERLKSLPGTPREFTYKVLKRATNDFDQMLMVGHGSYGVVYKGILQEENMEVAVKMFYRSVVKSRNSFLSEISIISRLRHKHLVPLIGWCHYEGMLFLVFQFMPNGSLDDHLCPQRKLSWDRRYKIVTGIASALHYLHEEYDQKVLHRDLKPSNVMLDSNFEARLGDFGLSKVLENGENSYAGNGGISGTIGYIAPECYFNGQATQETDVYAFGALVLEVVSGRHPCCVIADFDTLVDWVWKHYKDDCLNEAIDKSLGDEYVIEEANCLLVLGLACCNPIPSERPKTQAIVQIISKLIPPPYVPPEKPLNQMEQLEMGLKSMTDIPMVATLNSLYCASDHRSQQREIHEYVGAESSCNCIH